MHSDTPFYVTVQTAVHLRTHWRFFFRLFAAPSGPQPGQNHPGLSNVDLVSTAEPGFPALNLSNKHFTCWLCHSVSSVYLTLCEHAGHMIGKVFILGLLVEISHAS